MKRIAAFLGALLLALSFGAAGQLAMTGAGKNPAGGGGGSPVTFDSSVTFTGEDQTTPTSTDAWTIAANSNRYLLAAMMNRDFGTLGTHSGMTVTSSAALTQLGTTQPIEADTAANISRWYRINPDSGSTRVLAGTLSESDSVALISGSAFYNVNQTTPINSTPTAVTGAWSSDTTVDSADGLTITGTTVTNGMLVAVIAVRRSDTTSPTVTPGTGTTCTEVHAILESLYICRKADTGGSTTISPSLSVPSSSGTFRIDAYAVQP